jgi:hypothetical protein
VAGTLCKSSLGATEFDPRHSHHPHSQRQRGWRPSAMILATLAVLAITLHSVPADPTETVRLPIGYSLESTPMIPVQGPIDECGHTGTIVIPEESPEGGHHIGGWLDNSPTYTGTNSSWMLQVNDTLGIVQWIAIPSDEQLGS